MRIVIDHDLCEGNAVCVRVAPEVFIVGDDDQAQRADRDPRRVAAGQHRSGGGALSAAGVGVAERLA